MNIYWVPMQEDFYDSFSEEYDLVVFDEWRGQKTVQFMNSFLQGGTFWLKKKGGQICKKKNVPVIILSNYALSDSYVRAFQNDPSKLVTLQSRLLEIDLVQPIDLDNINFRYLPVGHKDEEEEEPFSFTSPIL